MLRYDTHVHLNMFDVTAEQVTEKLDQAGMAGTSIFSIRPGEQSKTRQTADYEERITDLLRLCSGCPDRLFPILWVHPDEDGILSKVEDAVGRGVMGFKIICNNFYVYEDKSMRLLEKIAALGKPVTFHSGILWDGTVSSRFNKPLNWEHCLEIPGLKFALAHCSWPWYDETIALYGKFLNAYTSRPELSAEMFLDLTPGTPVPYRRDLLTKLMTCGYDVKHNMMFGTDNSAHNYNVAWCRQWQDIDDGIYADLNVDAETLENIYGNNLKRFLGIEKKQIVRQVMLPDGTFKEVITQG